MKETSLCSPFQTKLRQALPGAVVIKHADRSMIGMVDASVTYNNKTVWMEYKFISPGTKGVTTQFMRDGSWSPIEVAKASPKQFEFAQGLARVSHCLYIFWVLDYEALRRKVKSVVLWSPLGGWSNTLPDDGAVVKYLVDFLKG